MGAWQFVNTWEPLYRADVAVPVAGPGQVVIDVKAAGLCHSDVGMMTDPVWLELLAHRPITIGHEVAGVISQVGEGVTQWQVGDRVGVCPTTSARAPGYSSDGGFADKIGAKDVRKSINDFADLGLDLIVDYAGFGNTTVDAISVVRNGGTVVLVGMGRLEATINTRTLITNKTTLIGSNGGDPEDIAGVY